jgi:hypothetical protein
MDVIAETCMRYDPVLRGLPAETLRLDVRIAGECIEFEVEYQIWKSVETFVDNLNLWYVEKVGYEDVVRTVSKVAFDQRKKLITLYVE